MTFKQLPIGEAFDFRPCRVSTSRILPCWKISPRTYGVVHPGEPLRIAHITSWHTPVYQEGLTGSVHRA